MCGTVYLHSSHSSVRRLRRYGLIDRNWVGFPGELDILVRPVVVREVNGGPLNWRTGSGSAVRVYDTSGLGLDAILQGTTNYGAGREPYASHLLTDVAHSLQNVIVDECTLAPTSLCRCEHTCSEDL